MDLNFETLVSSAEVQAARARARSLSCARHALENSPDKTLAWEARYLQTPVPMSADEYVSQRLENIRESIKQELKGHHRATITPRPAYRRSLNAANCELMSFREKFEEWKMTYDREIGKTKASLASMTPTLQGLGLAARFHKIAGKAAESLNGTPGNGATTPCNTVASTPRTLSDMTNTLTLRESGSDNGMEPSLQPLHLDTDDLMSTTDEYPDFLDDEPGLLSERSGKLAEVKEDIGVLTTIIEKKIFATHVPSPVREDDANVAVEEALGVDLCAWSEGALTARTIKMVEDVDAPPNEQDTEAAAMVEAPSTPDNIIPQTDLDNVSKKVVVPRISYKAELGLDDLQPRPVNLRDNLIILAKQKGFTHVGTPIREGVTTASSDRERAMALLRKMYAPSPTPKVMQAPVIAEEPNATSTAGAIEPRGLPVSESPQIMSPNLEERSISEAHHSGEVTIQNESKAVENGHRAEDFHAVAMPADLARSPNHEELERNSSIGSSIVSVTSSEADDDDVVTIPVMLTELSSEVRELVIGSYRNDHPLPLAVYECLDSGIAL